MPPREGIFELLVIPRQNMQSINKPRRLNVAETQRAAEYFHPLYLTYLSIVLADEAVRSDLRCTIK